MIPATPGGPQPHDYIKDFEALYPDLASNFLTLQAQQYNLFARKMISYGIENIALGTSLEDPEDRSVSLIGIIIRVLDKVNRLKNLILKKRSNPISDESIRDTWMDLANYSLIYLLVDMKLWKK